MTVCMGSFFNIASYVMGVGEDRARCKMKWFTHITHSGARYPVVPNTRVETCPFLFSDPILANPKSATLARKF